MEGMLQGVIVVFMLFLCTLCLFAVVVIVRDIITETSKTRRERMRAELEWQRVQEVLAQPVAPSVPVMATSVVEEPEAEEKEPSDVMPAEESEAEAESEPAAEAEAEAEAEGEVTFSRQSLTVEEKYQTLSDELKGGFDQIIAYVLSKDGVKEIKHPSSYDYKIGAYRVVRVSIKRGEIVCEFSFIDRDIINYANASNVRMKQPATRLRVADAAAVVAAKDGIDLVCTQIAEDKAYKKELAKEKRRERRRQAAQGAQDVQDAQETALHRANTD